MRKPPLDHDDDSLGLTDPSVTRRDFVGGALLGPDWTGPGGIGDYSRANGNTHEVVNAAHSIWKGDWDKPPAGAVDAGEFDLVVVGGGFSGLMAAYTFKKEGRGACLLLDNHAIFGGEAKLNEMEIDGFRLMAPQGSNGFEWPNPAKVWTEIGLPTKFEDLQWERKASGTDKPLRIPDDSYQAMLEVSDESDEGRRRDPSVGEGPVVQRVPGRAAARAGEARADAAAALQVPRAGAGRLGPLAGQHDLQGIPAEARGGDAPGGLPVPRPDGGGDLPGAGERRHLGLHRDGVPGGRRGGGAQLLGPYGAARIVSDVFELPLVK